MLHNANAQCKNCGRSGKMIHIPKDEPTENYKPTTSCSVCGATNWTMTRFSI